MPVVVGVDFGTIDVRVSIFHNREGLLGSATAGYPMLRKRDDPDYAAQRHSDHMTAFRRAAAGAIRSTGIPGECIDAIAADATGSTIVPVGENLEPLDDYYMWCDHRAWREAALITETAHRFQLEALDWCGGVCSPEWGWPKLLHWLRANQDKRGRLLTALEHSDMFAAALCGITDPDRLPRSIGVYGPKWMWNAALGGLPSAEFLEACDPLFNGIRHKMLGCYKFAGQVAGLLAPDWAAALGLRPGIPVSVGGLDGHWDTVGTGIREGDIVAVTGTSTPIMAISRRATPVPGASGTAFGSIHPAMTGIEAGLGASGAIWDAIARRAGTTVEALSEGLERYRAGQTGLLRLTWDNGDRTVLVNSELGGITFGWNVLHSARDELFAAFEGAALHMRIIVERMEEHGVPVRRVVHSGRIARKNDVLNRVCANVLGKPVLVPAGETTGLGAAIFAFLVAGVFKSIDEAQNALCPGYRTVNPDPPARATYDQLYALYRRLYFSLGRPEGTAIEAGGILPALRRIANGPASQASYP